MKETIVVKIDNIKVGKRYYSFNYKIWRNKQIVSEGNFDSSHSRSSAFIRKNLRNGWATELVLEHCF